MYYRIFAPPNSPIYFGKAAANRWDDPLSVFGVFYVGESFDAAAVETLLHSERTRRVLARQLETFRFQLEDCRRRLFRSNAIPQLFESPRQVSTTCNSAGVNRKCSTISS